MGKIDRYGDHGSPSFVFSRGEHKGDYTAIEVLEQWIQALGGVDPVTYEARTTTRLDVRHLERLPLGTSYPEVVELLRRAPLECRLVAVTITGGDHQSRGPDRWRVPKRDLVTGLLVLLENGSPQRRGGRRDRVLRRNFEQRVEGFVTLDVR